MSEAGEKTFAPTPKKKQDAARKGDVLRSKELATAAVMLVGAAWLQWAGPWLLDGLEQVLRGAFIFDRTEIDDFAPGRTIIAMALVVLPPVVVLGLVVLAVSLVSQLGFGEGRWVAGNLAFKGSRINPLSGLKRMFGPTGLIEIGKGLLKVGLLAAIAWMWLQGQLAGLLGLGRGSGLAGDLAWGWQALSSLLYSLSAGLVVIGLIDVPLLIWRRNERLKMSQQELRDEHKEAEGSPENKAAQRQRQREIAMGGVAHAMREAQFVITNPTHFSVALAWDPDKAPAPVVLAKGRGDRALAMRELAAEWQVPVLEYPALARSVYFTTRERQMIREELYGAVAAVLAFALSLKRGEATPMPAIEVPLALRFDAEGRREAA
ncbi:MAG TPA: EscU/YscU/HrcU family type III secretion system export apparatus switch protein [Novosphingobium sp.]|nr:EscU/YscU/HrcU family type III secretion system export apparatus switch protein [Novosphingobium sp.]